MSLESRPRSLSRTHPPAHRSVVDIPWCSLAAMRVSTISLSTSFRVISVCMQQLALRGCARMSCPTITVQQFDVCNTLSIIVNTNTHVKLHLPNMTSLLQRCLSSLELLPVDYSSRMQKERSAFSCWNDNMALILSVAQDMNRKTVVQLMMSLHVSKSTDGSRMMRWRRWTAPVSLPHEIH
jgi:hypothetical protein